MREQYSCDIPLEIQLSKPALLCKLRIVPDKASPMAAPSATATLGSKVFSIGSEAVEAASLPLREE
jgi:hypothetical protein